MAKTSTATEAGQESSLREGLEAAIRERVREVIELILEEEVEAALGASRSQRVLGLYLAGSNTRRIRGALEPLLDGAALSENAVSRLVLRLEESYRAWQRRDLAEEKIVYLYLDAIYPKLHSGGKVVSLAVLVALGVRENGEKVLQSLMTAGAESTGGWQMLLEDLAGRKMGRPRLVISASNPGLGTALARLWPGVAHQRCTVHKLRNLMVKAPKQTHEAVREDYHRIVYAANREAAERRGKRFWGSGRSCVWEWRPRWKKPAKNC